MKIRKEETVILTSEEVRQALVDYAATIINIQTACPVAVPEVLLRLEGNHSFTFLINEQTVDK